MSQHYSYYLRSRCGRSDCSPNSPCGYQPGCSCGFRCSILRYSWNPPRSRCRPDRYHRFRYLREGCVRNPLSGCPHGRYHRFHYSREGCVMNPPGRYPPSCSGSRSYSRPCCWRNSTCRCQTAGSY